MIGQSNWFREIWDCDGFLRNIIYCNRPQNIVFLHIFQKPITIYWIELDGTQATKTLIVIANANQWYYISFLYTIMLQHLHYTMNHILRYNRNTVWLRDMVSQTSWGKSAVSRYICLTVSCNHAVFPLSSANLWLTQQEWSVEIINPIIYQRMAHPRAHDVASQTTNSIRCPSVWGPKARAFIE